MRHFTFEILRKDPLPHNREKMQLSRIELQRLDCTIGMTMDSGQSKECAPIVSISPKILPRLHVIRGFEAGGVWGR